MTELQRILAALRRDGLDVESVEDGALVRDGDASVALFAEGAEAGGVLVRLHLDLNLYVDEEALTDVLMGINLMNQSLDYGTLILDPLDTDDEDMDGTAGGEGLDESITFAVLGRSVLWLPSLEERELLRLREHLTRFERELSEAVERTLHGEKGIRA
ncbi:hypothetical protein [Deinococcus ruber]|uniref:Uncharacterized protein n=1 Tax=Deinococcus ruber TaxID=1848197 RepID=A0A918F6A2_9DEIO|nr:hypothetical protein [Deinococcus ruber]GGR12173.1 hypothetical protein GCM10008957_26290 [Deinococcus ruber]